MFAAKPHHLSLIPGIHRVDRVAPGCPVASLWLTHAYTHTKYIKYGIRKKKLRLKIKILQERGKKTSSGVLCDHVLLRASVQLYRCPEQHGPLAAVCAAKENHSWGKPSSNAVPQHKREIDFSNRH